MDWGKSIRELRFLENLKQDRLARQMGVSQASVSQWERGVSIPPERIRRILRQRLGAQATDTARLALEASVTHSPNLAALLRLEHDHIQLAGLSRAGIRLCPLLRETDLGETLRGKLGGDVDDNHGQLIEDGLFEGRIAVARTLGRAERDGQAMAGITSYVAFRQSDGSWLARSEVRLIDPHDTMFAGRDSGILDVTYS